jgi:5-methylcytosine-specific restriction endonuclease McrA
MPFHPKTKALVLLRSGNRCECTRLGHDHIGRCPRVLTNAQFHHRTAQRLVVDDSLSNCEALCTSCHRQTGSYGRSGR